MENRFPNEAPRKVATIQDVARVARVSKGTVSKYLSNTPYVAKATKERIEAAIRELDYQPSAVAQSLSHGRSHTIGVIVATLRNPFYPELITGVEDAIESAGYTLLLATTDSSSEREQRIIRSMQQRRVDGMVVAAARATDTAVERLRSAGTQVVLAGRGLAHAGFDTVVLDNRAGAMMAVRHLLQHGHTRIAHIAGPQDIVPFRHRLEGYRDALQEAGVRFDESLVAIAAPEATSPAGTECARELLELDDPPTAVFAANDNVALGVLIACTRSGRSVPDDLAVIGFDNIWLDTLLAVPLTSVDGRAVDIGREAGALLADRIDEAGRRADGDSDLEPVQVVLQPQLAVRASCGCDAEA